MVEITEHTCATHGCGVVFWISERFENRRRKDLKPFYCPNGHVLVYSGETDEEKLARTIREKNQRISEVEAKVYELQEKLRKKNRKPRKK